MIIESITAMKALYFICGLSCGTAIGLYLAGAIRTGDVLWGFRK
jgi:hypothetical protein